MSYSAIISFKSLSSDEIIPFLRNYKRKLPSFFEQIADENFVYSPLYRKYTFCSAEEFQNFHEVRNDIKNWAMSSVFHHLYTYDAELGLLGVFGIPECMQFMFDKTVHFQNSCDQDYPREGWEGVKPFEDIFDRWQRSTKQEILNSPFNKYLESSDIENEKDLEYYRRSSAYKEIWSHFEDTLFDDGDAIYISLYGYYDDYIIAPFLNLIYDKVKKSAGLL